ncbi:acyl carrier protein [Chloroflexi bacterium TSY]|nr:acyl carrier protein [Chloroflexi bacterium TSY]
MAPQTQSQLALEVEEEISDLHVPRPCSKQDETQMVTLDVTLGSSQKRPSFATPIYTVDAIQTWLIQWLATHLQTVVDKIDVTTALADYGLDSVMALELLDALETWLQEPLEMTPTLFWNYPTISELAAYLANRTLQADELTIREKMQSQPQLDVSAGLISEKMNLSSLSDSEMAQLLAQEIAASRTRRAE